MAGHSQVDHQALFVVEAQEQVLPPSIYIDHCPADRERRGDKLGGRVTAGRNDAAAAHERSEPAPDGFNLRQLRHRHTLGEAQTSASAADEKIVVLGLLLTSFMALVRPGAFFNRRSRASWLDELDEIRQESLVLPEGGVDHAMSDDDEPGPTSDVESEPDLERELAVEPEAGSDTDDGDDDHGTRHPGE